MTIRKTRESGDEDERYVMSRAEDRSLWFRAAYFLEKYKLLVWVAFLLALAIGFQFKTPSMMVDELQSQITENKKNVDLVVIPRVDSLEGKINVLLKLQCIDLKLTAEQRTLVGLNCKKLLGDQ